MEEKPTTQNSRNRALKNPFRTDLLEKEAKERSARINDEFIKAFSFIKNYPKSVSIFGSTRTLGTGRHYKEARHLAYEIVKRLGYAVITGGGPGIMEAANRGAYEAGGKSIGLNIGLPQGQVKNKYLSDSAEFHYFFSRKVALSFCAETYVFFPGGYGTFDELFEIITLIQTQKIEKVPVILFGSDFWNPMHKFILKHMYNAHKAIDKKDMAIYTITDDVDEAIRIIKKAPVREGLLRQEEN